MGLSLSTALEIKASELINDKQWLRVLLCAGGMNLPLNTHKLHLKCFVSPASTGSPAVTGTASSTSVRLQWDEVDCIQRNSEITHYRLWYVPVPSAEDSIQRDVPAESYTIAELRPFTNYSIELAAVNNASQVGPKATIAIQTLQDSKS